MPQYSQCPECFAALQGGETCEALFHQMLFWENEQPELGSVHHLMVLCYHLQHPSLLSQAGLETGVQLLRDFLENGLTPEQARREKRQEVDSRRRAWKLQPQPGLHGAYPHPLQWRMTAAHVVRAGSIEYIRQVHTWARSVLLDVRSTGNLT